MLDIDSSEIINKLISNFPQTLPVYLIIKMKRIVTVVLVSDRERLRTQRAFVLSVVRVTINVLSERRNRLVNDIDTVRTLVHFHVFDSHVPVQISSRRKGSTAFRTQMVERLFLLVVLDVHQKFHSVKIISVATFTAMDVL